MTEDLYAIKSLRLYAKQVPHVRFYFFSSLRVFVVGFWVDAYVMEKQQSAVKERLLDVRFYCSGLFAGLIKKQHLCALVTVRPNSTLFLDPKNVFTLNMFCGQIFNV